MRIEGFSRGFGYILIVPALVISMAVSITLTTPVSAGYPTVIEEPGGSTIEVFQGQTFTIQFKLQFNGPASLGYFSLGFYWDSPRIGSAGTPSENFTFVSASAYLEDNLDQISVGTTFSEGVSPWDSTKWIHSIIVDHTEGCPWDDNFYVDIVLRASGAGGVPHVVTNNHPIVISGTIDVADPTVISYTPPDPNITIRVLPPVEVEISPSYQEGVPGAALEYAITVSNKSETTDNYDLAVDDNAGWNPTLSENLLENVGPGENRFITLSVTIPENAPLGTEDEIIITAASTEQTEVRDSDVCIAKALIVRRVDSSISPSYQCGLHGATLDYVVTVINKGTLGDNYNLTASDNAGWGPILSENLLENVQPGENRIIMLSVTIPESAAPFDEDNITVTATSVENASLSDSASCVAQVQPPPGLVSYWKFDEGSENIAHDNSGYANHGTIYGATWTGGIIGGALYFDGDDYVLVPSSPSLEITDELTLEAWVYRDNQSRDEMIVSKRSGETGFKLGFYWGDNKAHFNTGSTSFEEVESTIDIEANTWYHIAGTYDNEVRRIYINGVLNNSQAAAGQLASNTLDLAIGKSNYQSSHYFDGVIDEIKIYNRALGPDEILQHYLGTILEVTPSHQSGLPGENLSYTVRFTNVRPENDNYALNVTDTAGWNLTLSENLLENVKPGENREVTLTVTIAENATSFTEDNILVTATSLENAEVTDSRVCLARVSGKAEFQLVTLYKVSLDVDLYLGQGSKLVVKFYNYSDAFENESVFENFASPAHVVKFEEVDHPEGIGVKKARLDLTTDNTENVISTIARFVVNRSILLSRISKIKSMWPLWLPPEERSALISEISDIKSQWPYAPV